MTPEFRAWDKKRKEYFHITQLWSGGTKEDSFTFDGWKDNYGNSGFMDTVLLEQYTGLKDVNGDKIFEGDIIHFSYDHTDFYSEVVFNGGKFFGQTWTIPNLDLTTMPLGSGYHFNSPFEYYYDDMYVIGNIHENPELLGEEK